MGKDFLEIHRVLHVNQEVELAFIVWNLYENRVECLLQFFFTMGASLEDAKETGEGTKSERALKGSSRRSASTFSCEERGEENGGVSGVDDPQGEE